MPSADPSAQAPGMRSQRRCQTKGSTSCHAPALLHSNNPNSTGKRLRRLGYAARKAKIGHGLQSFGAKSPFSGELPVRCFTFVGYSIGCFSENDDGFGAL